MRTNHIIGGLILFSGGLFLLYYFSPYVVEFIKGAIQPTLIALGLVALAAAIFGNETFKKMNYIAAALFLLLGLYGLYDEYYAVMDFFSGAMPPLLVIAGLVSVLHGIRKLT